MALRYTNTEKWSDSWFYNLKSLEKLLFIYLYENCDIAGFIEVNIKKFANDLGLSELDTKGAFKGLFRGLIYSKNNDFIYIKNFLKNQKNYPLNENNNAHLGIIKRFEHYSHIFEFQSYNDFIIGACEGLNSPYGKGIGNSKEVGLYKEQEWYKNFDVYKKQLTDEYNRLTSDKNYIKGREEFHNGLDIKKSIYKACKDFWAKEVGWKNKKANKCINIDWEATFNKALSNKMNQVWKQKEDRI